MAGNMNDFNDRYYLTATWLPEWVEVTMEQFILAEKEAGLKPRAGLHDRPCTMGFRAYGVQGLVFGHPDRMFRRRTLDGRPVRSNWNEAGEPLPLKTFRRLAMS